VPRIITGKEHEMHPAPKSRDCQDK